MLWDRVEILDPFHRVIQNNQSPPMNILARRETDLLGGEGGEGEGCSPGERWICWGVKEVKE